MNGTQRNPFFQPTGFEPQEAINILEGAREAKGRLDKIKERKQQEKSHIQRFKYNSKMCNIYSKKHSKAIQTKQKIDQIQYGFDLAKWWGELHE